jgi:ATP-dependent helicase/DNAse subunit B
MRLLSGSAGSGKTTFVLDRLREALRDRDRSVRLLVPTATLAQHLRNRMAREGFVFSRSLIGTLSGFVNPWAGDIPQVPDPVLYLIVEDAVRRVARPEFARVAATPGFCAALARAIGDFSSAGCDSARLAACLPDAPLAEPFLAVYREVDTELARRGLALRARRLEHAAATIARDGLGSVRAIWMDGFHALPDPELRVIAAMGRHSDLTLTFDALDDRLAALGFREERLPRSRPTPARALVSAPSIEREVEEIARRILEQAAAGRPFREIGIIVRAQEIYVPILRSTLERFGIPARFYFDSSLERHAVIRFLAGAVDAMLAGWDHRQTLAVLRLAPRFAVSKNMDRFDFAVREQIPGSGLGALEGRLADSGEPLAHLLDSLGEIEEWRSSELAPPDWAARLKTLRNLFRPDPHASTEVLRHQATALKLFDEALDEAVAALDRARPIPLAKFWPVAKSVFRLKPLRLDDARRNVVHVISAPEARQWVLPVVFVCGMVEKQFPQFHRQDPFFPDPARCALNRAGIRVRTAADWENEEGALFESAISRATLLVTLSYPEFDSRGERNLPSLFLENLDLPVQASHSVRPLARTVPTPRPSVEIRTPALLEFLRQKTARLSPSQLEAFLQCPFQHFAGRLMRLKPAPPRPEERLDFLTQGNIVHDVLSTWWRDPQAIEPVFETVFARVCVEKKIPRAYHTERLRNAMLDDLRAFAAADRWPRACFQSRTEEKFCFPLAEGLEISGRIDRLDEAPGRRAYVIDYKYSRAQRTRDRLTDENLLQAPLYLLAAERFFHVKPAGMFYIGLKGGILYAGWSDQPVGDLDFETLAADWRERAEERTLAAAREIRGGRIEVAPHDLDDCRFCDSRDICRVKVREAVALAGEVS